MGLKIGNYYTTMDLIDKQMVYSHNIGEFEIWISENPSDLQYHFKDYGKDSKYYIGCGVKNEP